MIALLFPVTVLAVIVVLAALDAHGRQVGVANLRGRRRGAAPTRSGGSRWGTTLTKARRALVNWVRLDDDTG